MTIAWDETKKIDMGSLAKIAAGSQYIDTELVTQFADGLNSINQEMNNDFNAFMSKASELEDNWHSSAGDKACVFMREFTAMSESRSNVMINYVNLLKQQVDPNYISAENENTSLADEFK